MDRTGAFAAPGLFELLFDRVAATYFPSRRLVASAAMSAVSTEQLDRLLRVLGAQQRFLHVSPRQVELIGLVMERRVLVEMTSRIDQAMRSDGFGGSDGDGDGGGGGDQHAIERNDLEDAVALLQSTSKLLD